MCVEDAAGDSVRDKHQQGNKHGHTVSYSTYSTTHSTFGDSGCVGFLSTNIEAFGSN